MDVPNEKDRILNYLFAKGKDGDLTGNISKELEIPHSSVFSLCKEMELEGNIFVYEDSRKPKIDGFEQANALISHIGKHFHTTTSYVKLAEEKANKELLQSRLSTSVIDTNDSVKDTNRVQRRFIRLTALLAALTLVASMAALFKRESINVAPAPVILQPSQLSKDSLIKLIEITINQRDSLHIHP